MTSEASDLHGSIQSSILSGPITHNVRFPLISGLAGFEAVRLCWITLGLDTNMIYST